MPACIFAHTVDLSACFQGGKPLSRRAPNSRGNSRSELAAVSPSTRLCGAVSVRPAANMGTLAHGGTVTISVTFVWAASTGGGPQPKRKTQSPQALILGFSQPPHSGAGAGPK